MDTEDAGKIQGGYRAGTGQIPCRQPVGWMIFAFKRAEGRADKV
jgi:hypothetical protein